MSKHTPSPWRVDDGDSGCIGVFDAERQPICYLSSCTYAGHGLREEDDANARLIASVPKMMDVCKRVYEEIIKANYADELPLIELQTLLAEVLVEAEGEQVNGKA